MYNQKLLVEGSDEHPYWLVFDVDDGRNFWLGVEFFHILEGQITNFRDLELIRGQ